MICVVTTGGGWQEKEDDGEILSCVIWTFWWHVIDLLCVSLFFLSIHELYLFLTRELISSTSWLSNDFIHLFLVYHFTPLASVSSSHSFLIRFDLSVQFLADIHMCTVCLHPNKCNLLHKWFFIISYCKEYFNARN